MKTRMAKGGFAGTLLDVVKTPVGIVLMLVICLVLATLSIASAISGELTGATVAAAGFLSIIFIVAAVNVIGK